MEDLFSCSSQPGVETNLWSRFSITAARILEGVPGVEWEGVITKKGPFDMGGVGCIAAFHQR